MIYWQGEKAPSKILQQDHTSGLCAVSHTGDEAKIQPSLSISAIAISQRFSANCLQQGLEVRIAPGEQADPFLGYGGRAFLLLRGAARGMTVSQFAAERCKDFLGGSDSQMWWCIRPGYGEAGARAVLDGGAGSRFGDPYDPHARRRVRKAPAGQLGMGDRRPLG